MKNLLYGTALAAAIAVGAAAQTPSPTQPPTSTTPTAQEPSSPMRQPSSDRNQTFTGCLKSADSSSTATGTTGTAGATSKADNFILADAMAGASKTGSTAGTAGTAGAGAAASASGSSYRLTGGSKDDLRKYVNSKVEITGRLDNAGGMSGAEPGAAAGAGQPANMRGPQLHVESVKQIAASCSE